MICHALITSANFADKKYDILIYSSRSSNAVTSRVQSTPVSTTGASATTIVVVNSSQLAHLPAYSRRAEPSCIAAIIHTYLSHSFVLAANPLASVLVCVCDPCRQAAMGKAAIWRCFWT